MVQGKTGRPNYKIKKLMEKPEDEWIRVPGAHEPIISEVDFERINIAKHPDLELYDCYRDNGETGTNFERPGFQRMMEDVKAGRVDCIIVDPEAAVYEVLRLQMAMLTDAEAVIQRVSRSSAARSRRTALI